MAPSCLPSEVLIMIFSHLNPETLETVKQTCSEWRVLVETSVTLWKTLIHRHCKIYPPKKQILKLPLFSRIERSAEQLQRFYSHLVKVEQNVRTNNYRVRTINCLEAELEGKKVVRSSEWEQNHNYKGVYDMILDNNRLVASVYDTIQIWSLDSYSLLNILPSKGLDGDQVTTTCFTVRGDYLVCGTQNGQIKLFDMSTGDLVCKVRGDNSNYISDVTVVGDTLVCLDWFGGLTHWKFISPSNIQRIIAEKSDEKKLWEGPRILAGRENERLLDFSSEFLVCSNKCHLTCFSRHGEFLRSYPAYSDVFCISINGDRLAFGCKGDQNTPVAGVMRLGNWQGKPQVVFFTTRDNDPVISLSFSQNMLVLGDVNGELHLVDVTDIVFPADGEEVTVHLGGETEAAPHPATGVKFIGTVRTHEYRAFIWACKADPYRIFSGDETGKIIVHDYLMFES